MVREVCEMGMKCPCKGCTDRTLTCHSVCRRYEDWKIERAAIKDYTREMNREFVSDAVIRRHWRNLKSRRHSAGERREY